MKHTEFYTVQMKHQMDLLSQGFFGVTRGGGEWKTKTALIPCDFILKKADCKNNIYPPIRKDVTDYFDRYGISWWGENTSEGLPSGHLLSSQINCINHLFALRKDNDAILSLVNSLSEDIKFDEVLPSFIDDKEDCPNYISLEFICHNKEVLNENHDTRGAKCTSVDAMVYARSGNEKWLIPIEWKYTESYTDEKYKIYNFERYINKTDSNSRLKEWNDMYRLEPYYELGRQTLLMENLIAQRPKVCTTDYKEQRPLDADKFLHVIVVPSENKEMNEHARNFKNSLRKEYHDMVCIISPKRLLENIINKYKDLECYLKKRYGL